MRVSRAQKMREDHYICQFFLHFPWDEFCVSMYYRFHMNAPEASTDYVKYLRCLFIQAVLTRVHEQLMRFVDERYRFVVRH